MNKNESEFAKTENEVVQKIDEEIYRIASKLNEVDVLDISDQAHLELLEKQRRRALENYNDSYYRRQRDMFKEDWNRLRKDNPDKGLGLNTKDVNINDLYGILSNEPSENEKLMSEIKKCISELLELESQTEKLKKRLNAIKKQVEITDDETKGFYKL